MEGDDAVVRSICCRRQFSADSRRSNGKPGIVVPTLTLPLRCPRWWPLRRDNLTFYLMEWIIFWNKQVRQFSYNTSMFYVSYYLVYS